MLKKWANRAVWGALMGGLVAAKEQVEKGGISKTGLVTAVLAAVLGAVARSIQDQHPWDGEERRG